VKYGITVTKIAAFSSYIFLVLWGGGLYTVSV